MTENSEEPVSVLANVAVTDRELHQEYRLKLADQLLGMAGEHQAASIQYGQQIVRATFLANGAAIVAILALVGNVFGRDGNAGSALAASLFFPSILFSIGLVASMLGSGMGYFNFQFHANGVSNINEIRDFILYNAPMPSWYSGTSAKLIRPTAWFGAVFVLSSVLFFVAGATMSARAISAPLNHTIAPSDIGCRTMIGLDGKHYHLLFCRLEL